MKIKLLSIVLLMALSTYAFKTHAQNYVFKWDEDSQESLYGNFETFLSGVHNDFASLRGALIDSANGDKIYESSEKLGQFETQIEHSKEGKWEVSADYDFTGDYYDMNKFKEMLTGLMDKVGDSADNANYKLPKGVVRKIIGNGRDSYIIVAEFKKPQSYFILIGKQ